MTAFKKGAIWLANLNPQRKNEVGTDELRQIEKALLEVLDIDPNR